MFHISEFLNAFESLFYNTSNINTISSKIFLFRVFIFTSDKMYTKYTCKLAYRDLLNNRLYQIKQLYQHIKEGVFQFFFVFFLINVTKLTRRQNKKTVLPWQVLWSKQNASRLLVNRVAMMNFAFCRWNGTLTQIIMAIPSFIYL